MNTKVKIFAVVAVVLIAAAAYTLGGLGVTIAPRTTSAAPALYSPDVVTGIYDSASPAVFDINVSQQGTGFYGRGMMESQGTGFLIDNDGHILTNNHIVDGWSTVRVAISNTRVVDGKVVGTDQADDLALISVDPSAVAGITPLEFADSDAVKPGEMAIAIGSPFGLTDSITVGVVSGLNRSMSGSRTGMLQTDATINPGNSGGPLLNANGQVIGINTAVEAAGGARGIGLAVPSNVATRALPSLLAGQQITRPWLGISGTALSEAKAQTLGLSVTEGVYVVTVVSGGPAEKAGLKAGGTDANGQTASGGDVITAIDGKSVASVQDLFNYLTTKKVGDKVNLSVVRGGKDINVQVTLETWPDRVSTNQTPQPLPVPNFPWPWGGRMPAPGN